MKAALAQVGEGVILADAAGRITYVNDAAARLHGVARLDVPPEEYAASYHLLTEDGRPYPSAELPLARAVLRGETVTDARWRIRRPDGTDVHAVGTARPVLGPADVQVGAVLTIRDDTPRVEAARAEARAARILDQIADEHLTMDRNFRILSVNRAALRALGMPAEALVGKTHWEAFPASIDLEAARYYRRVVAERVEQHFTEHYVGEGYDRLLEIDAYPTEEGGIALFWRDITARVKAEAALRERNEALAAQALELELANQQLQENAVELETANEELQAATEDLGASERRTRTIAENATLAMFIMDEHQRCTYMNPAAERLTGFALEELQGKALHYYVHHTRPDGSPYPLEECPIDRAFPQNMREQGTETFVHKDGHFYPVAFTASPIREGARTVGTIIEARDIGEELAAEAERERLLAAERTARERADEANRAKSAFLATMSHELRTPLNAIQGHLQLVQMELHGPVTPSQREAMERIDRAQQHLQGLIADVLDYARIESGRVEYDVGPVLVAEVVRHVAPMVEPLLTAKRLDFQVRLPEDAGAPPVPVLADREKLAQVLLNLISNAAKFTPSGGRVLIELAEPGPADPDAGLVLVRVTDTGVGIPADKLEAIFEPFVQVRGAYVPGQGGTGLGLAISRDLARGMGGDLRVRSTVGAGSEFTVALRRP